MDIISQIFFCVTGTAGFAITMKAPKRTLKYIVLGGFICAVIERFIIFRGNDFTACLTAMTVLGFYCEITARVIKVPVTVLLMPSTIPLLPGSSIYYAMFYAIKSNSELTTEYAKSTLMTGLGIALGAIISSTVIKLIFRKKYI